MLQVPPLMVTYKSYFGKYLLINLIQYFSRTPRFSWEPKKWIQGESLNLSSNFETLETSFKMKLIGFQKWYFVGSKDEKLFDRREKHNFTYYTSLIIKLFFYTTNFRSEKCQRKWIQPGDTNTLDSDLSFESLGLFYYSCQNQKMDPQSSLELVILLSWYVFENE